MKAIRGDLAVRGFIKNIANDTIIIQRPAVLFISHGLTVQPRTFRISLSKHF
jgi:hypothetical protein